MAATASSRGGTAARTPYEEHREYVLAVLRRKCGWLGQDEREEVFHEAYTVVLEKERDGQLDLETMPAPQLRAFLTQTAIHKGLDEGKRAGRKRSVPLGDTELTEPDRGRAPDELAAAGMEGSRVREIVAELSPRKQAIIKLRYFFDRSPNEVQQYLGLTERAYRRELERAMRHILERYELVRDGSFCDGRRSVILAFVTGLAGPTRARVAREHLATCPSCARWAAELREVTQQAARVMPMPDVVLRDGPFERLVHGVGAIREQVIDAMANTKQHAVGIVARVDQTSAGYAAAARPGAVTMAVTGCLTLGGGATYCAVNGVPEPVRGIGSAIGVLADPPKRPERPRAENRPDPAASAPVSPAPIDRRARQPTLPATPRAERPQPRPTPAERTGSAPASPQAVEREFGFEGLAPPAPTAPSPAPPPPTAPPGEFDP